MTTISIIALIMVVVGYFGARYTELMWSTGHEQPETVTTPELVFTVMFFAGGVLALTSLVIWLFGENV